MGTINTIKLSPQKAMEAAVPVMQAGYSVMFHGKPGIGKSRVVKDACVKHNWDMRIEMLSQKTAGEVKGLPYIDSKSGTTRWSIPDFLPQKESNKPYLLFLDELLPATSPEVLISAYELLNDRKLGSYYLPVNVYLIGAGNRPEDATFSYEMPPALSDRLCHFHLETDFKSWSSWAVSNDIHPLVIGFLQSNPKYLDEEFLEVQDDDENLIKPSPRSWERVSNLLYSADANLVLSRIIYGWLGLITASAFARYAKQIEELEPIEFYFENINNPDVIKKSSPKAMDTLYGLVYNLLYVCTEVEHYEAATIIIHSLCDIEDGVYRQEVKMAAYSQLITRSDSKGLLTKFIKTYAFQQFIKPISAQLSELAQL